MENKKEEQMIYLKDLIFTVLYRWRAVLAVALILAFLLGGMQGIPGLLALKTSVDPAVQQEALEQYETERAALEHMVSTANNNLESCQTYLAEAPLMQLDPYSHYEVRLSLYVQTDYQILPGMSYQSPDRTAEIVSAYDTIVRGEATMDKIANALGTERRYVAELLTTEKENKGVLALRLILPTQEEAQTLLTVLTEQIDGAYDQVAEAVADHRVTIMEQSVSIRADAALVEQQKVEKERLDQLETDLTDAQTALASVAPPAVGRAGSLKVVVKKAVLFAVIGGILGVFLTVGVLWVAHIGSDKVYAARNLTNRTGIRIIGTVGGEKKNPVDRLVCRLEGRNMDSLATSPVAVDIRCRAKDAKRLLITGCVEAAERQLLVKAVAEAMHGVQVEDRGSILRDAQALEALAACDAVVLVEKSGVSRYSTVEKQINIIEDYGTELLGCVLLEK